MLDSCDRSTPPRQAASVGQMVRSAFRTGAFVALSPFDLCHCERLLDAAAGDATGNPCRTFWTYYLDPKHITHFRTKTEVGSPDIEGTNGSWCLVRKTQLQLAMKTLHIRLQSSCTTRTQNLCTGWNTL